jgi:hypothetical protein
MPEAGSPAAGTRGGGATLAALPIAAAATLLAARWLPLRFAYRPNELGIASVATETRYPQQQEVFWLLFALGFGTLAAIALARWLARDGLRARRAVLREACGAASLACGLFLPTPLAAAAALAGAAGARAAAGPRSEPTAGETEAPEPHPARRARGAWRTLLAGVGILALAVALTPAFLVNAWNLAHAVADERLVRDDFTFQGEIGQHLAWADALRRGRFHGRDFFCLYGPLFDLGAAGFWALAGRSIAAFELYFSITRAAGLAALLALAASLASRRAWALAVPFLVPWVNLRIGLALAGLLLLFGWLRSGSRALAALAGALAAASLLYSQEFGLAFALTSALAFALYGDARAALAFFAACAAAASPLLAWYAANGALGPMLRDLVGYPAAMLAGFGKLPFPSLAARLPLGARELGAQDSLLLRLGYAAPAVSWAAILLALRVDRIDPRRPLASARETLRALRRDARRASAFLCGVFGLLCFRTALGRSDLVHLVAVLPPAALLLALAADGLSAAWRERRGARALVAWRAAALALFVLAAGFAEAPRPLRELARQASDAAALWRHGNRPQGSREVMRVVRWLQLRSDPADAILFLPNDAAYYYLLDRPSPIRFVMGHQIATDAHRAEVLAALRRASPRFVVWDEGALRVDGLPDDRVFGRELLAWLDASYVEVAHLGDVSIRERGAATPER